MYIISNFHDKPALTDEETELRVIIVLAQVTASDWFGTLIPDLFHFQT